MITESRFSQIHPTPKGGGGKGRKTNFIQSVFLKEDKGFGNFHSGGLYHQLFLLAAEKLSRHRGQSGIVHVKNADHVSDANIFIIAYVKKHQIPPSV